MYAGRPVTIVAAGRPATAPGVACDPAIPSAADRASGELAMARDTATIDGTMHSRPTFAVYLRDFWRKRSTLAFLLCMPLTAIICGLVVYPVF
jgi:hypothetical protein